MYAEDDVVPISALAQLYYCARRAGLILLEQQWSDNVYTMEGRVLHERVHDGQDETRDGVRICRGVQVSSMRLGLSGVMDCLELRRCSDEQNNHGINLDGVEGEWIPVPVEYKHGSVRDEREYEVQLCAQAICLEEMLDINVVEGYLYYQGSKRRRVVCFTEQLRALVEEGARQLHQMLKLGELAPREFSRKCLKCSLLDVCVPTIPVSEAEKYITDMLSNIEEGFA